MMMDSLEAGASEELPSNCPLFLGTGFVCANAPRLLLEVGVPSDDSGRGSGMAPIRFQASTCVIFGSSELPFI